MFLSLLIVRFLDIYFSRDKRIGREKTWKKWIPAGFTLMYACVNATQLILTCNAAILNRTPECKAASAQQRDNTGGTRNQPNRSNTRTSLNPPPHFRCAEDAGCLSLWFFLHHTQLSGFLLSEVMVQNNAVLNRCTMFHVGRELSVGELQSQSSNLACFTKKVEKIKCPGRTSRICCLYPT